MFDKKIGGNMDNIDEIMSITEQLAPQMTAKEEAELVMLYHRVITRLEDETREMMMGVREV